MDPLDRLDRQALISLTGKIARPAQERVLDELKIPHERDGLGEIIVLREAVRKRFVPQDANAQAERFDGSSEPNYAFFPR